MAPLRCYFEVVLFLLSLWFISEIFSKKTYEYSQFYKDDGFSVSSKHMYNSQSNINAKLQRQTRDVVMMNQLPRMDPVKIGFTRNVHIFPGKTHQMKTLGIAPPIFEVENFLTDEECQMIIDLAKASGMEKSTTVRTTGGQIPRKQINDLFSKKDVNFNGLLEQYEMAEFFLAVKSLYLGEEDIKEILNELQLDRDEDGMLSRQELTAGIEAENYDTFNEYFDNLERKQPERKVRFSDTVFLKPSIHKQLFEKLRYRIVNTTGLPYAMVKAGEALQVVKYQPSGHYHSHLDSEKHGSVEESQDCCQYQNWAYGCTLCRYMTVLYFLNDVEEGGETAFPIADNVTVDTKVLFGEERYRLDLDRHCHDANVYYKPKKRSALIWYNHLLDNTTGWFGDIDIRSYHGGCNVIKGSKWIANNWIDASRDYDKDIDNWVKVLFYSTR